MLIAGSLRQVHQAVSACNYPGAPVPWALFGLLMGNSGTTHTHGHAEPVLTPMCRPCHVQAWALTMAA
jgi:hypothetical protein